MENFNLHVNQKMHHNAEKRAQKLYSNNILQRWFIRQVMTRGKLIAMSEGVVIKGFPNYAPISKVKQWLSMGPKAELVLLENALILCDPAFGPGAWQTIIHKEDIQSVQERGMSGENLLIKTSRMEALFSTETSMNGRAFRNLIDDWRIGPQQCSVCNYSGSFKRTKGEPTFGGWLTIFLSFGSLAWVPWVISSLRTSLLVCPECGKRKYNLEANSEDDDGTKQPKKTISLYSGSPKLEGWKRAFSISGRTSKKCFGYFQAQVAALFLIAFSINSGAIIFLERLEPEKLGVFSLLIMIPLLCVSLSLLVFIFVSLTSQIRRLHDTGRSGRYLFIFLVPFLGPFLLFRYFFQESERGENQYGAEPLI